MRKWSAQQRAKMESYYRDPKKKAKRSRRPKVARLCNVQGCGAKHISKGYCWKHYLRMVRTGTLEVKRPRAPVTERIKSKLRIEGECWIFTGNVTQNGYGWINNSGGTCRPHRILYEEKRGLIPKGLELDHLCRRPLCCNPDHLEAVTHQENCRRGTAGATIKAYIKSHPEHQRFAAMRRWHPEEF